jgi:electron transport complex protein RnfG
MSANVLIQTSTKMAGVLTVAAVISTALLSATYNATKGPIEENQKQAKLKLIGEILPKSAYDNDILSDTVEIPAAPELGTRATTTAYRARLAGQPAALVFEAVAPDGYSGNIFLVIAAKADGSISGVRVVAHKETPGLGDYIEAGRSKWITQFDGLSLDNTPDKDWHVRRDGGKFAYNAGATVTPRAIVKATHKAMKYFASNREKLFGATAAAK